MPRGSGPLTRALVGAALLASTTACVPFGTDANPTRTHAAPITSAPAATPAPSPSSSVPSPTAAAQPALGPLPDGVAPVRPAALDQPPTLEGAKAIAAYFLLLYPYAYQTGDLGTWNTLSHAECRFCASVQQHVTTATQAGQHTVGGASQITSLTGTEVDPGKFFDIQLILEASTSQVVASGNAVVKDQRAGRYKMDVVVLFDGGSWRVRGVQPEAA